MHCSDSITNPGLSHDIAPHSKAEYQIVIKQLNNQIYLPELHCAPQLCCENKKNVAIYCHSDTVTMSGNICSHTVILITYQLYQPLQHLGTLLPSSLPSSFDKNISSRKLSIESKSKLLI